jgi:polyribonucleotide nucleotidyltransferase
MAANDAVKTVTVEIAGSEISFETGKMAKQASGAVVVRQGDTVVLSTATMGNLRDADFLPLTVDIEERMYAAGKIPGSFFKREGRSGTEATLIARAIDRPLRPLFPKGWRYETQLVGIPLSVDHVHPYDILAMNGASAALMISPVPLPTPVGAVRIGQIEGNFVINPSEQDLADGKSDLDLVVAGTEEAILMVEAGANMVPEAEILDALDIAHAEIKKLCAAQHELRAQAGKEKVQVEVPTVHPDLYAQVQGEFGEAMDRATSIEDKLERQQASSEVSEQIIERFTPEPDHEDYPRARQQAQLRRPREADDPPADRDPQEAPGRPRRAGDPPDLHRGRRRPAHPRLRAVHRGPDPGLLRRDPRDAEGGDADRHARPGVQEVLLAPLQLPALLGRGGGLHARPQAP